VRCVVAGVLCLVCVVDGGCCVVYSVYSVVCGMDGVIDCVW